MDLSSLNNTLNTLIKKIDGYLDSVQEIEFADYKQQMDTIYISNQYNRIVYEYSNLLRLITETQYFISQCKKAIKLLSNNTVLEKQQKDRIKAAIDMIEEESKPLYNERDRLKVIEMFYRTIYTHKDF